MDDIVPALIDDINESFRKEYNSSKKIKRLLEKINSPDATYVDANEYAEEVGDILKRAFIKNVSSDVLPDGKMYYNIADRVIRETLGVNYELIADATDKVQGALNKAARIGINPIRPKMEEQRLADLIDYASSAEWYDDIRRRIEEALVNYSQSIVDDAVKDNADFQSKAGLHPKIIRKAEPKCCAWCRNLEGEYNYDELPQDSEVFRRHDSCRCQTYYKPIDGKKKSVWG